MTFNEWWIEFRGFDAEGGKEGMAYCWNSALDEAAKSLRDAASVMSENDNDHNTTILAADQILMLKNEIAINR